MRSGRVDFDSSYTAPPTPVLIALPGSACSGFCGPTRRRAARASRRRGSQQSARTKSVCGANLRTVESELDTSSSATLPSSAPAATMPGATAREPTGAGNVAARRITAHDAERQSSATTSPASVPTNSPPPPPPAVGQSERSRDGRGLHLRGERRRRADVPQPDGAVRGGGGERGRRRPAERAHLHVAPRLGAHAVRQRVQRRLARTPVSHTITVPSTPARRELLPRALGRAHARHRARVPAEFRRRLERRVEGLGVGRRRRRRRQRRARPERDVAGVVAAHDGLCAEPRDVRHARAARERADEAALGAARISAAARRRPTRFPSTPTPRPPRARRRRAARRRRCGTLTRSSAASAARRAEGSERSDALTSRSASEASRMTRRSRWSDYRRRVAPRRRRRGSLWRQPARLQQCP